jgi:CheY-like chemotaxis protein
VTEGGETAMSKGIVLIIDDDAGRAGVMTEILTCEGYEAQTARSGLEGLRRLRHGGPVPDVIVLDITMPVMDGVAFRRAQLRDPVLSRIPVLLASAVVPVHVTVSASQQHSLTPHRGCAP